MGELIDRLLNGVLIVDSTLRPLYANREFLRLLGLPDADTLLRPAGLERFLPEDNRQVLLDMTHRLFSHQSQRASQRLEVVRADNATLWLDFSAALGRWAERDVVQIAVVDATERVTHESELEFNRAQLENQAVELVALAEDLNAEREQLETARLDADEGRRFLQTLIATIPNPFFHQDLEGRIRGCNAAFAALHGRDHRTDMFGLTVADLTDAAFSSRTERLDAELMAKGGNVSYEAVFADAEGRARTMIYNKAVLTDAAGQAVGLVAVITDITEQKRMEEALRRLATTDPLTGALNRRAFMEAARRDLALAQRHGEPVTVALADIDHFKRVNDQHGHATGDEALKTFVATVHGALRASDVLGRMGGEEFALILPHTALASAMLLADRLRQTLANLRVPCPSGEVEFTVSIGLAELGTHGTTIDTLLQAADEALYRAKSAGRNRVIAA
ncbi:sensor domain-containing diguanylate cyclase [Rhodospirillum rubrum]|nr:sensor domain-containing diguanylate cyclase [Rhodospirillum rubrum]AEO49919.1 diguanylate cyclase [Rhodospirillum rubrum F11]QXG80107.1 diguanylate cyclase [Rhodospirillum rubrum]